MQRSLLLVFSLLLLLLQVVMVFSSSSDLEWPVYPFKRTLSMNAEGNDVYLMQLLLSRDASCNKLFNTTQLLTGVFDVNTLQCLIKFQQAHDTKLSDISHNLTPNIANQLVSLHMFDGYVDEYVHPNMTMYRTLPGNYKYYVYAPVMSNRNIQTTCGLYDRLGKMLHSFTCRLKGQLEYNQLTSDGDTPTGLYSFDLNTPEDDPKEYGPYDVNRAVYGLKGNAQWIYPKVRSGILLHTGEWNVQNGQMPDSHGCIHAMPQDIKLIAEILTNQLGIVAHENLFGKYPYPFQPQGLLSVVQMDK